MKLLLITNRRKNKTSKYPEKYYIEEPRLEGAGTTEMAMLNRKKKDYSIEPIADTESGEANREKRISTIESFLLDCIKDEYDCVFYIHGYGKTFVQSIEQAVEIRNRYSNASVITFSWPAKEKEVLAVHIRERYEEIQEIAKASIDALKEMFSDLGQAVKRLPANKTISINLIIHSLGNYMLEHLIRREPNLDLKMFDNIIHNQADVDISTHVQWIEKVIPKKKVYITANKHDSVLLISQMIHQEDMDDRLGDSIHIHYAEKDRAENAIYVDFTIAKDVMYHHQLFGLNAVDDNNYIRSFFERVFSGKDGVKGESFEWSKEFKCYEMLK